MICLLLASCGGSAPRASASGGNYGASSGDGGGGGFMGMTRSRCADGDEGACRILRAMDQ